MITGQDKDIAGLVADIREGRLLLPELQRRYVWKASQVRDLFDSLYHNYPSGQLLVWETDDILHAQTASLTGITGDQRRPQLLLDGQQRLTSLTAVMTGQPLAVRDSERPIDIVFNVETEKFEVANPVRRADIHWISLTKLFTEGTMAILMDLQIDLSAPSSKKIFERLQRLENIKSYQYRVNVLADLDYDEVTHIFVRVNSGGTILGSADLALAQVSSRWRGVTHEFSQLQDQFARQGLQLDSGLLLRAMAVLLNRPTRLSQFFRGDRQPITEAELSSAWKRVQHAIHQAVSFLVENCRIDRLTLLPTNNILIPLIAFFDRSRESVSDQQIRALQRWVYMALIWSRYSGTVETRLDQDVAALRKDRPVETMIENIEDQVGRRLVTERELQDQNKNSPYMLMAYVLARRANAQDWFNGVEIGPNQPLEIHHVFPSALLRENYDLRKDRRTVNQVANLVFLSRRANAKIASSEPATYLPSIDSQRLRAQNVPLNGQLWSLPAFEQFALERRKLLADAINQLLKSLAGERTVWPISPTEVIESRLDGVEHQLRDIIADLLLDTYGDAAWQEGIPKAVRSGIEGRLHQRLQSRPYEQRDFESFEAKISFAQFSDYSRIIKSNWQLFSHLFGTESIFDQWARAITEGRNSFKHNRALSQSDRATTEAGLLWFEECLRSATLEEGTEEDSEEIASD